MKQQDPASFKFSVFILKQEVLQIISRNSLTDIDYLKTQLPTILIVYPALADKIFNDLPCN